MTPGIIVDNFAGGGGASTGIEAALGRAIDIAINHDEEAIRMHEANHPGTLHIRNNVWQVDPREIAAGRHVQLAWFSPDCKHFSKAKGGKPREKSIRDLAWVVVLWAQRVKPDLILLENVEEFRTWGPLDSEGYPIKDRAGETFAKWTKALRRAGYKMQWRELRACDYGAPTIRKRFFMVARCDGQPIVWPKPTHGKPDSPEVRAGKLKPWRTAAEIIDWTIPCPSIFERKKPLAEKTLRRIAHGIMKFVVNNPSPFIVPICNTNWAGDRFHPGDEPLRTITTARGGEQALVTPYFTRTAHGDVDRSGKRRGQPCHGPEEGFPTVTQSRDSALITPFIAPLTHHGSPDRSYAPEAPLPTVTGANRGEMAAIVPHITKFRAGTIGHAADEPLHTVTANSYVKRPGGSAPLGVVEAVVSPVVIGTAFKNTRAARAFDPQDPLRTQTAQPEYGVAEAVLSPVIVGCGGRRGQSGPVGPEQPYPTTTAKADACVAAAVLTPFYGDKDGRPRSANAVDEPIRTQTAENRFGVVNAFMRKFAGGEMGSAVNERASAEDEAKVRALVAAHLAQMNEERRGVKPGRSAVEPVSTITTSGSHQQLVTSNLVKLRGTCAHGQPVDEPLHTISAQGTHMAEVRAFLLKYYSAAQHGQSADEPLHTLTHQARFGLVTVMIDGEEYAIVDIGMRMLAPRELFNAQSFPPDYIIDHDAHGKPITKTAQVAKCGNSVCPVLAEALVRANMANECAEREGVAA